MSWIFRSSMAIREFHPYGEFIPKNAKSMIIGSFPIGKFTNPERSGEIKAHEFNFFFGGEKNLLWRLIGDRFNRTLKSKDDIVGLLEEKGIGLGDVIRSCERRNGSASDADLLNIEWNKDLLRILKNKKIKRVYFISRQVEKWFTKLFPESDSLEKILLISPSAQSFRSLSRRADYQKWKAKHPKDKAYDFILLDYHSKIAQD